tara:strand:+ start:487 stop:774 length:288 start_codon:yes stop_codon:yes gene_type:complete
MDLGLAVKTLRKNKGLTQGNFCETVGITQSYLSQVENGNKEPSMDVVKKIADALDTPIPVLFWFTLTEDDVDESKVEVFKLLKPSVDSLVDAFFN